MNLTNEFITDRENMFTLEFCPFCKELTHSDPCSNCGTKLTVEIREEVIFNISEKMKKIIERECEIMGVDGDFKTKFSYFLLESSAGCCCHV